MSSLSSTDDFDDAVHKLTSSRSPLAELVADPVLLRSITKSSHSRKSRSTSKRRDDDRSRSDKKRDRDKDSASRVLTVVLAEEEREVQNLRSQLLVTAEKLKSSMREAAEADSRAATAQSREREAQAKIQHLEHAKHTSELELSRQAEELKRYRQRVEDLERQLAKADGEMRTLERQKNRAEESASEAKDALRLFKQTIRDERSREEGIAQGKRMGLRHGYSSGRLNGFRAGRQDGFDKGYRKGEREGRFVGEHEGRKWEKSRALSAFRNFIAARDELRQYEDEFPEEDFGPEYDEEYYEDDEDASLRRTQTWAESVSRHSREPPDEIIAVEPSLIQSSSSGRTHGTSPGGLSRGDRSYYMI